MATKKVSILAVVITAFVAGLAVATSVRASRTPSELVKQIADAVTQMQQAQAILNPHPPSGPSGSLPGENGTPAIEPIPESVVKEQETHFIVSRRILLDDLAMLNRWALQSKDAHTVVSEVYPWSSETLKVLEDFIKKNDPKTFDGRTSK